MGGVPWPDKTCDESEFFQAIKDVLGDQKITVDQRLYADQMPNELQLVDLWDILTEKSANTNLRPVLVELCGKDPAMQEILDLCLQFAQPRLV